MIRYFIPILLLIFAAILSANAQTQPTAAVASKIVIVDTVAFFNEKSGITRIVTAAKTLSTELTPKRSQYEQTVAKLQQVEKEVTAFRDNVAKGIPIDERAAQAKVDELERLKREGKYQEDDYNNLAQTRQRQIVGPEYSAALKALDEYVRTKGYGMVFDVSKDQNGILIFATEQYNITKDFIAFYNARPPTAINSVPK